MFWGAQTAQLDELATRMSEKHRRGTELLTAVDATVHTVAWTGEDAAQLRARWQEVRAEAGAVLGTIAQRGTELRVHAEEQERASAPEGGGAGAGGPVQDGAAEYDDTGFAWIGLHNGIFGFDGGLNLLTGRRDLRDDIPIDDPSEYGIASMNQMGVPNCITIAMLGGLSEQDPQYFMDRIEQIGTERYEVTLYQDGQPVTITVEGEILSDGARGSDGLQNWMTLYETALIEHGVLEEDGTYAGSASDVVEAVTGVSMPTDVFLQNPDGVEGSGMSIEEFGNGKSVPAFVIAQLLDEGYTVVAGTDNTNADLDGATLVEQHAYVVTDANGDTFTLENPWGAGDHYGGEAGGRAPQLTGNQLGANSDSLYVAPPRNEWSEER